MKAPLFGNKKRGVSTLEILIAFAMLTLSLTAVMVVVFSNQSVAVDTQISDSSLGKAEAMLEAARANARADFNLVNPTSSVETSGALTYTKSLAVSQVDLFTKQATSIVTWTVGGRTLSTILSTLLTNPVAATGGGTSCSSIATGNWKNPQHHEWDLGQLGVNGNNGNGFGISNVAVFNKRIYLTMYATPNNDKDTVFVFDEPADPTQPPVYRGSVDNDAGNSVGPNALAVASTSSKIYLYLATASRAKIQTVDVTDPTNPTIVNTFTIPTSKVSTAGTPFTIFYKDGYVYLGLSKISGGGPEFNIIDVGGGSGSPTNPVLMGGYDTGSAVSEIYVKNNYAYLATTGNENMTMLDVSNPALPTRVGGYTPPNAPESEGVGSDHGETIMTIGTTAYLGRTYGSKEFYILNATTPSSITVTGSQDVGTGNQSSIYGLAVRNTLAFFITNTQFQVWDISNPASIKPYSSDGTTNTFLALSAIGGTGTAQDCESNLFYLAVASSQGQTKDLLSVITAGP